MCEDEKRRARNAAKARRATLSTPARDEALARVFFASPFAEAQRFFVYLSFGTEADTSRIVRGLLARGKTVFAPRVEGGRMRAVPYTEERERDECGILAPLSAEEGEPDVILTPLLAADGEGNRLGYGGGYYDAYFGAHPAAKRVGFAYAGQVLLEVPHGGGDVPLDVLITEEGVRFFGGGKT